MFGMGPMELMIIGCIAVLLFGSKLPEVARSLGGSYREFKKGLNEFQSATQYDEPYQSTGSGKSSYDYDEYDDSATAPRFEPPPAEDGADNSGENSGGENSAESGGESTEGEASPEASSGQASSGQASSGEASPSAAAAESSDETETSEPKS